MNDFFKCPICLETLAAARVALCGHLFCSECYYNMVDSADHPACAVCRRPLTSPPYPNYEVDALLDRDDDEFRARVRRSRERTAAAAAQPLDAPDHAANLSSAEPSVRCAALANLLCTVENVGTFLCADMRGACLTQVVAYATAPSSRHEHLLAWRLLAHAAEYFRDGSGLLTAGVHSVAAHSLVHPMATVASRRAVTRAVRSLAETHPGHFDMFLRESWLMRLLSAAPAAVAHVAIASGPSGVRTLAAAGALTRLLVVADAHERVLGASLLDAALGVQECRDEVLRAAAIMLRAPVPNACALAKICWRDDDAARVVATCHMHNLAAAVRTCATGVGDFDEHMAVLDVLQALLDNTSTATPALVTDVLAWVRRPDTHEGVRAFGLSYAAAAARFSAACAEAALNHYGCVQVMTADETDDPSLYLAGDVFTHERLVDQHASSLTYTLGTLTFVRYSAVYFASALAGTPRGLALVADHAQSALRAAALAAGVDEVTVAACQDVCEKCESVKIVAP